MLQDDRVAFPASVPAPQYLHGMRIMVDSIKSLEVLLHDKSPDTRMLADLRVTLREEIEALAFLNDRLAQIVCGGPVMRRNLSYDSLKVFQEGVLEDYLVVHPRNRFRTSFPEYPWPVVASAFARASS